MIWRIMQIEEPSASADNTLLDLHNSSYHTKAEFNNCFIIYSKYFQSFKKDKIYFVELLNKLTTYNNIQQFPLQSLCNHVKLENKWNFDLSGFMRVFTVFIIQFPPRSTFQTCSQPFPRFLTVQYQSHCCVTSIVQ